MSISIDVTTYDELSLAINKAKTLAGVLLEDCAGDDAGNDAGNEKKSNLTYMLVELIEGIESKFDGCNESCQRRTVAPTLKT